MLHTTEVMAIFVIFLAYFDQNMVALATSLRPLQSEVSFFGLVDPSNHTLEQKILSIAVTQAKLCRFKGSLRK